MPARLVGTSWTLDGLVDADTVSAVPQGVTSTLRITEGRLQVSAGCNTGAATVEIDATRLTVGPMALTRMACPPAQMEVEQAVTTVLQGSVTYRIDGVLTLERGSRGLVYRAAAAPAASSAEPAAR